MTPDDSNGNAPPTGWAAIKAAVTRRPSRGQWIVAVLLLCLGFGVAAQVRTTQQDALAAARTSDLVRILDDLSEQRERLSAEEVRLRATLSELESGADQAAAAREAARERAETLRILAGVTPVSGPGVSLTITDPDAQLDASDLLDAVQELRDAGADAIAVDGERVVVQTAIVDSAEGIVVGDTVLESPYQIDAIGPSDTLATGLSFPGGVLESVREAGANGTVARRESLLIPEIESD
ncbi:MAG TPA: DUF881 domain-containing protein [Actinomycetes bacterium]|nr:DUF881 domain-containing protein [Actinomycetes bacterium]